MACGQLLSPSIQKELVSLNIFFTVVLALIMLGIYPETRLAIQTSLVPWLCDICEKLAGCACNIFKMIVDCACYAIRKFADEAIETDDKYRREKDAHSQAREESVSNEYEKRVRTQSNATREFAKDGAPPETMTEFVRSTRVPQPEKEEHSLLTKIGELCDKLSAFLKSLR